MRTIWRCKKCGKLLAKYDEHDLIIAPRGMSIYRLPLEDASQLKVTCSYCRHVNVFSETVHIPEGRSISPRA